MNKKEKILEFIIRYIQKHGYSPSYREIGDGVGLKSLSSVSRYVQHMIEIGVLETDAEWSSARALRVPGYKFVKEG